ncbi:MAG: cytochrome P450 [Boseongicola sp.]|nr:cytochrome P450 [Boseongicola sp.]
MRQSQEWHASIESEEPSFRPPAPERRKNAVGILELIRLYRQNLIAVFSETDYKRDIISTRFGLLDVHVVNSPNLVKEAFQSEHAALQAKTPQMRHALSPLIGDGLFVSDRDTWTIRRAAVAPIIHTRRLEQFLPIMLEVVDEWSVFWKNLEDGAEVDMLAEMAELTAEIISRTVFGRRLGRQFTTEIVSGFRDYQTSVDQLDPLSLIRAPDWFPRFQRAATRRALRKVHRVIDGVIDEFAAGRGDQSAVIAALFETRDKEGRRLTKEAIRNEAIVIFMAGHETTANTLAWAWYLLSQSKRVRGKLHAELDTFGVPETLNDARQLSFSRAIIEETLRLYPPVPMLGRQAIEDTRIGETEVKKGSLVLVSPFMLQRKEALFGMPDNFIPERFDDRIASRPEKYEYVPFSVGPRICPGLTFGLIEAVICLAKLGSEFDPELAHGHVVEERCRLTLRPGETLPMRLARRNSQRSNDFG